MVTNNIINENSQKKEAQLKNFPCVFYATDAIFQQAHHPPGPLLEGKFYFRGKEKMNSTRLKSLWHKEALTLMLQSTNQVVSLTMFFRAI